jgi:hypothetical protein
MRQRTGQPKRSECQNLLAKKLVTSQRVAFQYHRVLIRPLSCGIEAIECSATLQFSMSRHHEINSGLIMRFPVRRSVEYSFESPCGHETEILLITASTKS